MFADNLTAIGGVRFFLFMYGGSWNLTLAHIRETDNVSDKSECYKSFTVSYIYQETKLFLGINDVISSCCKLFHHCGTTSVYLHFLVFERAYKSSHYFKQTAKDIQ